MYVSFSGCLKYMNHGACTAKHLDESHMKGCRASEEICRSFYGSEAILNIDSGSLIRFYNDIRDALNLSIFPFNENVFSPITYCIVRDIPFLDNIPKIYVTLMDFLISKIH